MCPYCVKPLDNTASILCGSFLVSDPLTVLGLLIDSAPHIGFHAVCAVLFHFFRDMAIYVVPRSLLGTARKAAPPNGGAALRQLVKKVRTDFFDKLRQNCKNKKQYFILRFWSLRRVIEREREP